MEKSALLKSLNEAVAESFEGIAFMEYDSFEAVEQIPVFQEPDYITTIEIIDPYKGSIDLLCQKTFIHETAETLLGDELSEDEEAVLFDTLGELINTVAGRFMAHIIPENQDFTIGLPITGLFDEHKKNELTNQDRFLLMRFDFMDNPVFCRLSGQIIE